MTRGLSARRVLVVGAARSGAAAAAALIEEGIAVKVIDSNKTPGLEEVAQHLAALGAETELGVPGSVPLDGYDAVVTSPAVPPTSPVLVEARKQAVPVLSEPELAFRLTDLDIVGITGTNGKTTTTWLVGHILAGAGVHNQVCGNVGPGAPPMVEAARHADRDAVLVAELSSFQLEYTNMFRPKVAVLLNLTQDHTDWHGDFGSYMGAKLKLFANQRSDDFAVVNFDDPLVRRAIPALQGRVVPVSHHVQLEGGIYIDDGVMRTDFNGPDEEICRIEDLLIKGHHNVDNAMAAAAVAVCLGVPAKTIGEALRTFHAPEHRLEEVETSDGRLWVNDSKATNPDSAIMALAAYDDPMILLGGYNKGSDFSALVDAVAQRAKAAVLFGKAGEELEAAFSAAGHTASRAGTLREAIEVARRLSAPGDVILLSPACASFDEFKDYEERGRAFKVWVAGEERQA